MILTLTILRGAEEKSRKKFGGPSPGKKIRRPLFRKKGFLGGLLEKNLFKEGVLGKNISIKKFPPPSK